jgi:hypothetical protein
LLYLKDYSPPVLLKVAGDVLIVALFYTVQYIGARKGIQPLHEDQMGGFSAGNVGLYAPNEHLWNVE